MKGYYTDAGYRGWLPSVNEYVLFACEEDYYEQYNAESDEDTEGNDD